MRFSRFAKTICIAGALSFGVISAQAVAQDNEDQQFFCSNVAASQCFNTMGYTTQECEAVYYDQCLGGGSHFPSEHGPRGTYDPARDCTGGVDIDGNYCV